MRAGVSGEIVRLDTADRQDRPRVEQPWMTTPSMLGADSDQLAASAVVPLKRGELQARQKCPLEGFSPGDGDLVGAGGDQDSRPGRVDVFCHLLQYLAGGRAALWVVYEDRHGAFWPQQIERLADGCGQIDRRSSIGDRGAYGWYVSWHVYRWASQLPLTGRDMTNRVPFPGSDWTLMVPWCSRIIRRVVGRPSPVPPGLVE